MPDETGLSGAEGSAAGAEDAPKPAETDATPAGSDVGEKSSFDHELGLVPEAGEAEEGETEGSDGFEDYDKAFDSDDRPPLGEEGAEGAEDEVAAKEVDEAAEKGEEEKPPEAAEQEAAAEEETPPEKFEFGGEEFDSKEAAEQNFKSLRGQHKNVKATEAENAALKQENATTKQANDSWEAFHKAEMEKAQAGQKPQGSDDVKPGETPEPGADDAVAEIIAKKVDWKVVEKINEDEGVIPALQWALYEALSQQDKRFSSQLKEGTEDFRKTQELAHQNQLGIDTFMAASQYKAEDGTPLYPELQDAKATTQIFNIWNRLDVPDNIAYSPRGVYFATLAYRDSLGRLGPVKAQASTTPAAEAETDPVVASLEAARKAGTEVAAGSERTQPGKPKLSEEDHAVQAILNAGKDNDPDLGFTR